MKKFDIVLVEFPFSDLSNTKLRPAVVVAVPGGQNVLLCQLTTKKRNTAKFEVGLPRKSCSGDIRFDSNIYVDMLFTLHQDLIQKRIGRVNDVLVQKLIRKKLQVLVG
ncbi:growth inhibitor PemK [Candidatus Woesearchaeota archaeon]|nr:growth inhibitor PemK [Candidatus Woesearchaeota archaeon]|tara:strand:- start:1261 stop:1584 length:324 start_codon:yes stop_codon:yes gene_type:complete